jgi:hypothetical protein
MDVILSLPFLIHMIREACDVSNISLVLALALAALHRHILDLEMEKQTENLIIRLI